MTTLTRFALLFALVAVAVVQLGSGQGTNKGTTSGNKGTTSAGAPPRTRPATSSRPNKGATTSTGATVTGRSAPPRTRPTTSSKPNKGTRPPATITLGTVKPTRPPKPTLPPQKTQRPQPTPRPKPGTTTFSPAIDVSKLDKDEKKRLNGAFDASSMTTFSGGAAGMFDKGNISQDFMDALDSKEQSAANDLQSTWKDVMDVKVMFQDKTPDDVQFFLQQFEKMDKSVFEKFNNTPGSMQAADLKDIPLDVIAAMNDSVRADKLQQLPSDVKGAICDKLQNGDADFDITQKLDKGIDCADILRSAGKVPEGNLKQAIAENKMDDKPPSSWTPSDWEDAIKKGYFAGLPDGVIEKAPANVIRDNAADLRNLTAGMDPKLKERVMDKLKDAAGGASQMSANDLKNMGDMVKDLPVREMKQMNSTALRDSLSTFRDNAAGMSKAQKMQIRKTMKDSIPAADWTGDDLVNAAVFIGRDRSLLKDIDKDVLIANISSLGQQDIDDKSARSFAKKIRESTDYDDPSDFDTTKFREIGKIATGLSSRFVKDMSSVNFGDLLDAGDLSDIDFKGDSSRVVIDRIKQDAGKTALDKTDLQNLGKNVKGLRKADVDNMTADDIADTLDTMKDTFNEIIDDMDKTTVDGMIQKIENASGGLADNLEKMGAFLQKVPVKKLANLSSSDFGDMSGDTARDFNCSKDTCPLLYSKVVDEIGQPGIRNPNMTLTVFKNMGKVMCGMPLDDLKMLPATSALEGIVGHLLDLGCLSDKQERVLADKIKYRLGLFGDDVMDISRQDVKTYGAIFKHFDKTDLERLGKSVCDDIVTEVGARDMTNVKKNDLKDLAKFALECRNKSSGSIDTDDITSMGGLITGIDAKRVADVDSNAMQDAVFKVQGKCDMLGKTERKAWATKAMDKLNITKDTVQSADDVSLTQMGTLLADVSDDIRGNIPDDKWSSIGSDVIDQFDEREKNADDRKDNGLSNDVSNDDQKDMDKKKTTLYGDIKDSYISTASRRRRRSSSSTLTCDDMQLLGSGVTSMTTSQIEAMADSDFLDCASFLGGFSTWTSSQLDSLLTVATRSNTYGSTSAWTADHVYSSGIISQGLSSSEITALADLTDDAMYSIGRHDGWAENQLTAGFSRWLGLNKGSDASTVTSTELISLGHFVCGATTSHIGVLSNTAYSYAASYIGELTSCDASQMELFADHAFSAFGSLDTWDTSVMSSVGTMIGGFTSAEIGSLSDNQIAAIEPSSIGVIPSSSFVGFSVSQLSTFSVAQAQATTANQQAGLSSAQLDALIAAGATVQSSAGMIQIPITMILLIAALSTLVPRF